MISVAALAPLLRAQMSGRIRGETTSGACTDTSGTRSETA